jgi:hypothetical protein
VISDRALPRKKESTPHPHVKKNRSRAHEIFCEAKGYGKKYDPFGIPYPKEPSFFMIK